MSDVAVGQARVLVVVPTLGQRPQTLERTLDSIVAQNEVEVDTVVVAPVRTPSLDEQTKRRGVRLEIWPGHISAAVNHGWRQAGAAHAYLAWLGDDDMLRPGALARATRALQARPQATVAFGCCDYIGIDGQRLFTRRPPPLADRALLLVPGLIKQETCVFRRSLVETCGWLDESLRYAMDLDLLLRLRSLGPFVRVEEVQAAFCWHPGSITLSHRRQSLAEAQAIQRLHSRGVARLPVLILQPLLRRLVMVATARINRRNVVCS